MATHSHFKPIILSVFFSPRKRSSAVIAGEFVGQPGGIKFNFKSCYLSQIICFMLSTQLFKFGKALLPCALLTRKVLGLIFAALMLAVLWWWEPVTVFENFPEVKNRFEQTNPTTFMDFPKGISEPNMRVGNFPSMCHIFLISRDLQKNSFSLCNTMKHKTTCKNTQVLETRLKSTAFSYKTPIFRICENTKNSPFSNWPRQTWRRL